MRIEVGYFQRGANTVYSQAEVALFDNAISFSVHDDGSAEVFFKDQDGVEVLESFLWVSYVHIQSKSN